MYIRPATPDDASTIQEIYAYYVRETAITFAEEAPDEAHWRTQIANLRYPFFVAENGGAVVGFAHAGQFREKAAFRWDVELTVYAAPGCIRQGVGSALMEKLLAALSKQGYLNAYSCITLPNAGSMALHERYGFVQLGIFPCAGYKLGKWHDVAWMHRTLGPVLENPAEPHSFQPTTT